MDATEPERLLKIREVAEYHGVSNDTVIEWLNAGLLPYVQRPNGWRAVRVRDCMLFVRPTPGKKTAMQERRRQELMEALRQRYNSMQAA